MIRYMKKLEFYRVAAVMALMLLLGAGMAQAQEEWSQEMVCRGWNNPNNFTDQGMGFYSATKYSGRVGSKPSSGMAPNALSGETGVNWGASVTNNQMEACTVAVASSNAAIIPANKHSNRPFEIYSATDQVTGHPVNRDPNTGDQLPFVPVHLNTNDPSLPVQTNLTKSIRVGTTNGRPSGGDNCAALYYTINVRPENALLYLYYACVFQDGGHGTTGDPAFMVRVMKQNDAGTWVQASPTRSNPPASGNNQCDTLAYFITATSVSSGGSINLNDPNSGWHGSFGYNNVLWKEWDKVVINLTPMMYSTVRVEVMVSGCYATVHYAYAYVCGECRPMQISTSGCPAGRSTYVTTLSAPPGLRNYVWERSEYGGYSPMNNTSTFSLPLSNPNSTAYYTFHQLTPDDGTSDSSYLYRAQADDFAVEYMPNDAHTTGLPAPEDSMTNKQVFRCKVRSAINPSKPYDSYIYSIVQNIKPTMEVRLQSYCGGDVELKNESYVTGSTTIQNLDSTVWSFYSNEQAGGPADTVIMGGETARINFPGSDMRYVKVRTNIHEDDPTISSSARPEHNACYSEDVYPIQPLPNPVAQFAMSDTILCASDPVVTLTDVTPGSTARRWIFRSAADDSTHTLADTLVETTENQYQNFQHVFPAHSDGVEPVGMIARNGYSYQNPVDQTETIWCEDTVVHTINIFTNPKLEGHGDSIVCQGDKTKVWVTSDIENCTYRWSTTYGSVSGGNLQDGDTLKVSPYADTATYYVLVTSPAPQNCQAWDSARVFLVRPRLTMVPPDGQICPGDPVVLKGSNAYSYTWTATPADASLAGQDSAMSVTVYPSENTTYTLIGHGSNNCNASPLTTDVTVHPYPVPTVSIEPGIVDSENPTVTLRDDSPYSVSSMWTFAGAEQVPGREVTHTFEEATGADSVYVTLTNLNDLGCATEYPFAIPVNLYTAWFPNVFTPGSEDENACFRLYTRNVNPYYEHFHIYIYNRFGQLVYESSDPTFAWDGTMDDGSVCPQGTYTYICRYRKPGAYTVAKLHGSITLVR